MTDYYQHADRHCEEMVERVTINWTVGYNIRKSLKNIASRFGQIKKIIKSKIQQFVHSDEM